MSKIARYGSTKQGASKIPGSSSSNTSKPQSPVFENCGINNYAGGTNDEVVNKSSVPVNVPKVCSTSSMANASESTVVNVKSAATRQLYVEREFPPRPYSSGSGSGSSTASSKSQLPSARGNKSPRALTSRSKANSKLTTFGKNGGSVSSLRSPPSSSGSRNSR